MNVETKGDLREETIEKVQEIIQANIDSRDGFLEAAEKIDDPAITAIFHGLANERSGHIDVLSQVVTSNGVQACRGGSTAAKLHRYFIDFRAALNGGDRYVLLVEAERGEDYIKHLYEDVLKNTAGSAVNDILQRQYAAVKKGHDRVRDLRDSLKDV